LLFVVVGLVVINRSEQLNDALLLAAQNVFPQSFVNDRALAPSSAKAEGGFDQLRINLYVSSDVRTIAHYIAQIGREMISRFAAILALFLFEGISTPQARSSTSAAMEVVFLGTGRSGSALADAGSAAALQANFRNMN
jgi:hypothetical protein